MTLNKKKCLLLLIIFLTIISIFIWAAVHLGKKAQVANSNSRKTDTKKPQKTNKTDDREIVATNRYQNYITAKYEYIRPLKNDNVIEYKRFNENKTIMTTTHKGISTQIFEITTEDFTEITDKSGIWHIISNTFILNNESEPQLKEKNGSIYISARTNAPYNSKTLYSSQKINNISSIISDTEIVLNDSMIDILNDTNYAFHIQL